MPTWKKVIVSGSNISQLNNDSGYLTAGTLGVPNSFSSMSINGTIVIADTPTGSLVFASSSGAGLNIVGSSAPDTITFNLTAIPNSSLLNSGSIIGTTPVNLGTTVTTLAGLSSVTSTTFVGALTGTAATASNITPAITNGADNRVHTDNGNGTITAEANLTFDGTTLDVRGTGGITTNQTTFPLINTTATTVNAFGAATAITMGATPSSTITLRGATLVGDAATQNVFNTTATTVNAFGAATAITMGATAGTTTTIRGGTLVGNTTTQNVFNTTATTVSAFGAATTLSIGAGTGTTTVNNNLVVTGDLTVNGTTTTINTTELLVEDKFILLSSGSAGATDGGIIVQGPTTAGVGFGYFLDSVTAPRWGFTSSLAAGGTGAVTADEYAVSAKSVAGTWTAASAAPTYGGTGAGYGNMVIDNNGTGDIWIYCI